MKPLFNGLLTGLFLQLALGPVFFYVLGITVASSYINGLYGIVAVTIADYIYIVLSLAGVGKLLQDGRGKTLFGLVSSAILVVFGAMTFYKGVVFINGSGNIPANDWTPVKSFTSCFILTISSPLTIIFWGSVFSAKAIEKNYKGKQLVIFGAGTGLSTFLFLSSTMMILCLIKKNIPDLAVQILSCIVGLILICYGIERTFRIISARNKAALV